jgi:hypothetical protein
LTRCSDLSEAETEETKMTETAVAVMIETAVVVTAKVAEMTEMVMAATVMTE